MRRRKAAGKVAGGNFLATDRSIYRAKRKGKCVVRCIFCKNQGQILYTSPNKIQIGHEIIRFEFSFTKFGFYMLSVVGVP